MHKLFLNTLNFVLVFSIIFSGSPSLFAEATTPNVRGIEQEETKTLDTTLAALSAGLYLPRKLVDGTFFGAAKTAKVVSDPDFIRKVEDILYIYKRDLAWFPTFSWQSGYRPNYGAGIYYSKNGVKSLTRFSLNDSDYYSFSTKASYTQYFGRVKWKTSVAGLYEKRDDRRFYGIGSSPMADTRNVFLSPEDFGVFTEERRKLEWSSSIYPAEKWGFTYLGYYQRRGLLASGKGDNDLRDRFRVSAIQGFNNAPITQIYNELSFKVDTRDNDKMISRGFRSEVYSGISVGLENNDSDFVRFGADVAAFIPVIKENRVLVPRIVFNGVNEFDDRNPIPFTEFPRNRTFRGVSDKDLIRSDKLAFVPSLEYQWPLSHVLSGHIFIDTLIVGPTISDLGWDDGLWAAGVGVDFHYREREFGRAQFAVGSEGFQFTFTIGTPLRSNSRSDWK